MSNDRGMNKEDMCVCVCVHTHMQWNNTQPLKMNNAIFNTDGPRDYYTK